VTEIVDYVLEDLPVFQHITNGHSIFYIQRHCPPFIMR